MKLKLLTILLAELIQIIPVTTKYGIIWNITYMKGTERIDIQTRDPQIIFDRAFHEEEYDPLSNILYLSPARLI